MGWTYSVNNTPATGADAWIIVISTLLTAGWTIPQWSDGTTVHTSGTPIAADFKVLHSWFRMRSPADPATGQNREFVVQNGKASTSYNTWAAKYSASAGFTNFVGSAVNAPASTDEVSWPGLYGNSTGIIGNTSSSGSFQSLFGTDGGYRFHMAAGDAAQKYSFFWLTSNSTTTTIAAAMMLDIPSAWAGTADLDPANVYCDENASNILGPPDLENTTQCSGHSGLILGSTTSLASLSFQNVYASVPNVRALPTNSWSGNVPLLTPLWFGIYQNGSIHAVSVRGWSNVLIFDMGSASRTNYDLFTVSATGDHIWINGSLLPWPSGTAVTI